MGWHRDFNASRNKYARAAWLTLQIKYIEKNIEYFFNWSRIAMSPGSGMSTERVLMAKSDNDMAFGRTPEAFPPSPAGWLAAFGFFFQSQQATFSRRPQPTF
jgi:hypothetical protein